MKNEIKTETGFCEIKVRGKLEPRWAEWFDSMKIEAVSDATIISGAVADQSALLGLIEKICTIGLTVVSIKYDDGKQADGAKLNFKYE